MREFARQLQTVWERSDAVQTYIETGRLAENTMAARYCSQCGREMASTAQFCPACGAPANPSGREVTGVVAATNATRKALIPAMVAALVVLVIVVAILMGHRHPAVVATQPVPPPVAPSVIAAPPAAPPVAPPVTSAPSQPAPKAPAVTSAPSKTPPALPPEDARYLAFLQQIDQRRIALDNDTSGATQMLAQAHLMQGQEMNQADPDQHNSSVAGNVGKLSSGFSDYVTKWNMLARDFRAVNPPPDCSLIANSYYKFLTGYAATISKLQVALLNGDIGAAMGAQGAQQQINADAMAADQHLSDLCTHYGVPKPFSIQVEGASSPLTGM